MGEIAPSKTDGKEIAVQAEEAGLRLDRWFRRHFPDLPHAALERFLRRGMIRVNQRRAKAAARLESGALVRVPVFSRREIAPKTTPLALSSREIKILRGRLLYHDDALLVLNKPAGLAVQGGTRLTRHLDAMLEALQFDADQPPQLTHRLDKETSGALILARNPNAAAFIAAAFRRREIDKTYLALVRGKPTPPKGEINTPAGKKLLPARTRYQTLKRAGGFAWVEFSPMTGRTHQIRSHAAAGGFSIAGDRVYGSRKPLPQGFARMLHLHSYGLAFTHPNGKRLHITAPLPEHMERAYDRLWPKGDETHV